MVTSLSFADVARYRRGYGLFAWQPRINPGANALTMLLLSASLWTLAEGLTIAVGQ